MLPKSLLARDSGPVAARFFRWTGRIASLASLGLLAMFATSGGDRPSAFEWLMLLFFPIGVAAGTIVAWRRELLGGALAAGSLVLFHALMLSDASRPPAGWWFLAFTAPALAMLLGGLLSRRAAGGRKSIESGAR